jgi:hypothetical protein
MRNPWKLTTFVLIALLAVLFGSKSIDSVTAEPQPRMQDALMHLNEAQNSLQNATADKGGHRAKAISLTRQAIKQVEAGIRYDNRR